jgi:hypothetical protein
MPESSCQPLDRPEVDRVHEEESLRLNVIETASPGVTTWQRCGFGVHCECIWGELTARLF